MDLICLIKSKSSLVRKIKFFFLKNLLFSATTTVSAKLLVTVVLNILFVLLMLTTFPLTMRQCLLTPWVRHYLEQSVWQWVQERILQLQVITLSLKDQVEPVEPQACPNTAVKNLIRWQPRKSTFQFVIVLLHFPLEFLLMHGEMLNLLWLQIGEFVSITVNCLAPTPPK